MSAATDYLTHQIGQAGAHPPIVTFVTCQQVQVPPPGFKPGIASYGWGVNGKVSKDANGAPNGIAFGTVNQWFSDRIPNLAQVSPPDWQQFDHMGKDLLSLTLIIAGDEIELAFHSISWGVDWNASTSQFDSGSQQLLFGVPGAGPNAPPALMILSVAPHEYVAWL
jgi:hypothetical protein